MTPSECDPIAQKTGPCKRLIRGYNQSARGRCGNCMDGLKAVGKSEEELELEKLIAQRFRSQRREKGWKLAKIERLS